MLGSKKTPFLKSATPYLTMMKLDTVVPYLKKINKIFKSRDIPHELCLHQHFSPGISNFCYIKKYLYIERDYILIHSF